jgi:hypothetical protein
MDSAFCCNVLPLSQEIGVPADPPSYGSSYTAANSATNRVLSCRNSAVPTGAALNYGLGGVYFVVLVAYSEAQKRSECTGVRKTQVPRPSPQYENTE